MDGNNCECNCGSDDSGIVLVNESESSSSIVGISTGLERYGRRVALWRMGDWTLVGVSRQGFIITTPLVHNAHGARIRSSSH